MQRGTNHLIVEKSKRYILRGRKFVSTRKTHLWETKQTFSFFFFVATHFVAREFLKERFMNEPPPVYHRCHSSHHVFKKKQWKKNKSFIFSLESRLSLKAGANWSLRASNSDKTTNDVKHYWQLSLEDLIEEFVAGLYWIGIMLMSAPSIRFNWPERAACIYHACIGQHGCTLLSAPAVKAHSQLSKYTFLKLKIYFILYPV